MKLLLQNHGLLSIVDGTYIAPDQTADQAGYEAWFEKDQKALLLIILALKTEGQNCMYNAETSKDCWDKLADQYQGEGDQ